MEELHVLKAECRSSGEPHGDPKALTVQLEGTVLNMQHSGLVRNLLPKEINLFKAGIHSSLY